MHGQKRGPQQGLGITGISTNPPPIAGAPTYVALFVGWAPSGPTDRAVPLFSFSDYEREFGGLDARALLGYAVRHFYDNGGSRAHVLRIAGADGGAIAPAEPAFAQALNVAFAPGGPVDKIDAFNLICVPGLADAAATAMLQVQAAARCETIVITPFHQRIEKTTSLGRSHEGNFGVSFFGRTVMVNIYRHDDKFLIVNDVPCLQCAYCGEQYFEGPILRNIEKKFHEIHVQGHKASQEIHIPVEPFLALQQA